ncbi:N-acetylmuramoyl-L-alanine amidase [Lachnospiraceae bacterium KM106-2]|nr:N-acetylmuramoyl-L-alanine amidase [Lachnospiraceae bacterium KM106-2]
MKIRKIICFIICIGCIACVCIRMGSLSLNAAANSSIEENLEVEQLNNNSYVAKRELTIKVPIEQKMTEKVKIDQDHLNQTYKVSLELKQACEIKKRSLEDQFLPQTLQKLKLANKDSSDVKYILQFEMKSVYEVSYRWEDDSLVLQFQPPKKKYNKIIVLDAGHGGSDCGALSQDKKHYEKDINLAIVKKLGGYLEKEGVKVYFTRVNDKKISLDQRVTLANMIDADLFLSIHCNSVGKESPNGSAAFYAEQTGHNTSNSKKIAELLLESTQKALNRKNIGTYSGQKYYVVGHAVVPTVLLETAFISNNSDLNYLINKQYQDKLAKELGKAVRKSIQ